MNVSYLIYHKFNKYDFGGPVTNSWCRDQDEYVGYYIVRICIMVLFSVRIGIYIFKIHRFIFRVVSTSYFAFNILYMKS